MTERARQAADVVARASYARLLALLAGRSRDIAAAEDALSDAFRAALDVWPRRGVPDRPEAWLLIAARRAMGHAHRHQGVRAAAASGLRLLHEELHGRAPEAIPDHRLRLLFVCSHPAIDAALRTPLMLQVVLGLDAARIAAAFLVAPAAMAQRLVRAKAKIRDAGIGFEEPGRAELPARLAAVLAAIYAAYGTAWDAAPGTGGPHGLAQEALFLGRLLVALMPDQPEARGLLALMLHCEARGPARRTADGQFVPLDTQDTGRWSRPLIAEAEHHLGVAARSQRPGRYQTEAAIQSVHAQRGLDAAGKNRALVLLYDVLAQQAPSAGVMIARAAAHAEAFGPDAGMDLLGRIDPARVRGYQAFWAVMAHLLQKAGRSDEAGRAFDQAIALSDDPAVRYHLAGRALGTGTR